MTRCPFEKLGRTLLNECASRSGGEADGRLSRGRRRPWQPGGRQAGRVAAGDGREAGRAGEADRGAGRPCQLEGAAGAGRLGRRATHTLRTVGGHGGGVGQLATRTALASTVVSGGVSGILVVVVVVSGGGVGGGVIFVFVLVVHLTQ